MLKKIFSLIASVSLIFISTTGLSYHKDYPVLPSKEEIKNNLFHYNSLGNPIVWRLDALPIQIMIEDDFSKEELKIINLAVNHWNTVLGKTIFVFKKNINSYTYGTILVNKKDLRKNPKMKNTLGVCRWDFLELFGVRANIEKAEVTFWSGLPESYYFYVAVHEFGHALGLAHDDSSNSIMFPYPMNSEGNIDIGDIIALRKIYNLTNNLI